MKRPKLALASTLLFFTLFGCTYHNEDFYFKDNPDICYTENMSYTNDIVPIFENNCYSCHNSDDMTADIDLGSFSTVQSLATSGTLIGVVSHADGYSPMPLNNGKLSDCEISKIQAWIDQGTLKN